MSKIRIKKIEETEFIFKTHDLKVIDPKKLKLLNSLDFSWDLESEEFYIGFTVIYNHLIGKERVDLAKFSIKSAFRVSDLNEGLKVIENGFELPDEILITLVSTVIGTTRGMLSYKLAGTLLADYYLPLIDAKQFLESSILKENTKKLLKGKNSSEKK